MKKFIAVILSAAMCVLMTACVKSEEVKNVEAMIEAIGTITKDSGEALRAVEEAYAALPEDEQARVENYDEFTAMRDTYDELCVAGAWYPYALNPWEPDTIFEFRYSLALNEDMTVIHTSAQSGVSYGTWKVKNGQVVVSGIKNLESENYSMYDNDGEISFNIDRASGAERLQMGEVDSMLFVRKDDYLALAATVVRAVDCSDTTALNEYFAFAAYTNRVYDEWDVFTGTEYTRVTLQSLLYDEGWRFIGTSADFALEVLYPEYTETYTWADGDVTASVREAGDYTITQFPFSSYSGNIDVRRTYPEYSVETDLELEQFSFGRGRGYVYFINSSVVEDIQINNDGESRELFINITGGYSFLPSGSFSTGPFEDDNNEF